MGLYSVVRPLPGETDVCPELQGKSVSCVCLIRGLKEERPRYSLSFLKSNFAVLRVQLYMGAKLEKLALLVTTSNNTTSNITTTITSTAIATTKGPSHLSAHKMLGVGEWDSSMLAPEETSSTGAVGREVWPKSGQGEWIRGQLSGANLD